MTIDQNSKELTAGVKRGDFPSGAATVLVLDHFQDLWERYGQRVPQECNLLFVRDTTTAEAAMRQNPAISVVIAQGLSRKVDNLWLGSRQNTLAFLKTLQQQGFGGLVQVVSRTLASYHLSEMLELEGLRVQCMDKQNFLEGAFVAKAKELWQRIARFERYEQRTGRKLDPNSSVGRSFAQLRKQVINPHPAEDRLFDKWEHELIVCRKDRATTIEMALTWLAELKVTICSGDVRTIYDHASQLPDQSQTCDCLSTDPAGEYNWLLNFHSLHNEFNQAVWEILDMAGLTEWMRLELELDLAAQNPESPDFGRHVSRKYGEQLREFFGPEPSWQWVGKRSRF
ncbi:MAG TPA: hypothetical protein VFT87_05045 [Candidatus Saccharimonadales bacterium]|nr:hypothetical protein [Candidatus Saccharimonadales bacterium]